MSLLTSFLRLGWHRRQLLVETGYSRGISKHTAAALHSSPVVALVSLHHRGIVLGDSFPAPLLVGGHSTNPILNGGLVRQLPLQVDVRVLLVGIQFGRAIGLPVDSLLNLVRRTLHHVGSVHRQPILNWLELILAVVASQSDSLA